MKGNTHEKGQAIVLILVALVAMFGFVGLAVDGGRVLSERRRAQNAADSAAYAAASAAVAGDDFIQAALDQADLNSFVDASADENVGNPVDVIVNHPPTQGQFAGDDEYYEVIIRNTVTATFGRAILLDDFQIQAIAVSHAQESESVSGDNVIHALDTDSSTAFRVNGDIDVEVFGGNIFSNSGITKNGGSGDVVVTGGNVFYTDGYTCSGDCDGFDPYPLEAPAPIFAAPIITPSCGSTVGSRTGNTYHPGTYNSQISINGNGSYTFEGGVYCLNDGMRINGGADVTASNVLFVLAGGNIRINGGSDLKFIRDSDITDAEGRQYGGLLFYVPPSNNGAEVVMTGGTDMEFAGTILNPTGMCEFGGNADSIGFKSNIICWHIWAHGNPLVRVDFRAEQNFRLPSVLELSE